MLIVGIDPGSLGFGIGVVKKEHGRITYVWSEEITLREADFYARMRSLHGRLQEILPRFRPAEAAMEEGFLGKNVRSMAMVATVRGVVLGSLITNDMPLTTYSPREVKAALTGYGHASKEQIGRMAAMLLGGNGKSFAADEADALAVAYCHAMKRP